MSYQKDFWVSNIPKLHSRQFNCKPFSALCLIFFKAAHMSVLQLVHVQAKLQVKMVAGQWCNYKLSDQFADIHLARQAAVFHWVYSSCWSFQLDYKKRGSLSFFFSSVRSSNSHPDLLVITTTTTTTTPLFQITPVLNTGLSLSEPL